MPQNKELSKQKDIEEILRLDILLIQKTQGIRIIKRLQDTLMNTIYRLYIDQILIEYFESNESKQNHSKNKLPLEKDSQNECSSNSIVYLTLRKRLGEVEKGQLCQLMIKEYTNEIRKYGLLDKYQQTLYDIVHEPRFTIPTHLKQKTRKKGRMQAQWEAQTWKQMVSLLMLINYERPSLETFRQMWDAIYPLHPLPINKPGRKSKFCLSEDDSKSIQKEKQFKKKEVENEKKKVYQEFKGQKHIESEDIFESEISEKECSFSVNNKCSNQIVNIPKDGKECKECINEELSKKEQDICKQCTNVCIECLNKSELSDCEDNSLDCQQCQATQSEDQCVSSSSKPKPHLKRKRARKLLQSNNEDVKEDQHNKLNHFSHLNECNSSSNSIYSFNERPNKKSKKPSECKQQLAPQSFKENNEYLHIKAEINQEQKQCEVHAQQIQNHFSHNHNHNHTQHHHHHHLNSNNIIPQQSFLSSSSSICPVIHLFDNHHNLLRKEESNTKNSIQGIDMLEDLKRNQNINNAKMVNLLEDHMIRTAWQQQQIQNVGKELFSCHNNIQNNNNSSNNNYLNNNNNNNNNNFINHSHPNSCHVHDYQINSNIKNNYLQVDTCVHGKNKVGFQLAKSQQLIHQQLAQRITQLEQAQLKQNEVLNRILCVQLQILEGKQFGDHSKQFQRNNPTINPYILCPQELCCPQNQQVAYL